MAAIRKLGSIYYEGAVANPGLTCYTPEPKIFFGNTVPGKELRWVVAGERLVGDRCACTNISWNCLSRQGFVMGWPVHIDGRPYMCRCPSVGTDTNHSGEWDALLDEFGIDNSLWNWSERSFWGQETHPTTGGCRILRGYYSARSWSSTESHDRLPTIGFRPVLEPLPPIPDDLASLVGKHLCVYGPGRVGFVAKLKAADEYDLILEGKCELPDGCRWAIRERGMILVRKDALTWLKKST